MADVKVDDEERLKISVVIPYCSFESDLIFDVVNSLSVCDDIVIVYMTHFFNGEEDLHAESTLDVFKSFPNVRCIRLVWKPITVPPAFWVSEMRMVGFARSRHSWMLACDSDECLRDQKAFKAWFKTIENGATKSFKLTNYWYFMSKKRRANIIEDSITLTHRSVISMPMFRQFGQERSALLLPNDPRNTRDLDGNVFFDHFSWVRSPENLRRKVLSWSHRKDRDWVPLVDKALSEDPLLTEDFVHKYSYTILE